ncbi:MAG: NADPH:quinone reductase [Alphaproteobacteria bacterium]|jgi:NADPH2:quinone reductase|nr:NADPH:quinone reductase [Alphaproteobacteria bacterium]
MKAIVAHEWGGPEVLTPEQVPDPEAGPGEVLIRLQAVGINPAETYMRSGIYAYLPDLPCILGSDGAGVIEALGADVDQFEAGQRVYVAGGINGRMTGCYAELVTRPADEVFPLPDGVSFAAGAAVGVPYATAYCALFQRGRAKPGESLFIHGASGAVGTAAIQLARASGLIIIGSAGSDRGRDLVLEQGAHHAVDHGKDGYLETVRELTGGAGPDLILEMLANVNLQSDLDLVARFGRIVVVGNRGTIEINPRAAMMKELDILGLALWNYSADELRSVQRALIAGLENGSLRPVVGREMPLAEASRAHVAVLEPGAYGKIVLIP